MILKHHRRRWTNKQLEALRIMRERGRSESYMAKKLNRTLAAIRMKTSRMGLYDTQRRWTDAETKELMAMRTMGVPLTVCKRRMNTSRSYNALQLKRNRVERKRMKL